MNAKQYLTIAGILAVIYGVGFLVIPSNLLMLYGAPAVPEPRLVLSTQYFGSALLGLGLVVWFIRDCKEAATLRGVLIANVIGDVVGFVVTVWGMVQGLLNAAAWSSLVIYGLLALGAVYLLLTSSERQTAVTG